MKYTLRCSKCGASYPSSYNKQICGKCNGNLEVIYNGKPHAHKNPSSFWDFEGVLPDGNYKHYFVGLTPLVRHNIHKNLYLKLELMNPTKSFKDRGSVVEVAKAREYKYHEIACASTGNMAYSIAHFAKLYGLRSHIFISNNANKDKINDIKLTHDAFITQVDGDFNKALDAAASFASSHGAFLAGDYCYRQEGQKTIAYEIISQLPEVSNIIVPVGNATLISGIFRALLEMRQMKILKQLPRLIAVQASGSAPLLMPFRHGTEIIHITPHTKADAIAVGYPTFGFQALTALKATKGVLITVTDKEMQAAQSALFTEEGLIAELGGVASLAAYKKIKNSLSGNSVAIISGGNV